MTLCLITGPTDYRYDCPAVRQVRQALFRALDRTGAARKAIGRARAARPGGRPRKET